MSIAYVAHTVTATFHLDEAGICCDVDVADGAGDLDPSLARCVGGQYVASLDLADPKGLLDLPRAGASLLFVVADAHGRCVLLRTGALTRFEVRSEAPEEPETEITEDDLLPGLELVDELTPSPSFMAVSWPGRELLASVLPSMPIGLAPPPRRLREALAR